MVEIGKLLRSVRIREDLTLEQAAEKADINASHLSEIERGKKVPGFSTVEKIIHSYKYTLRLSIESDAIQFHVCSSGVESCAE